jgi:hypothetical protein
MTTHQNDLFRTQALGCDDGAESDSAIADDRCRLAGRDTRDEGSMVSGAHHIRKR